MPQLVIAAAGAYIGSTVGYAALGWAIGSTIGGLLFPTKVPTQYNRQQVMNDLRVFGTEYGQSIPKIAGAARMAGQLWWNSDRRAIETTTSETQGGKGGGGEQTVVTTIVTYDVDLLIGLTNNQIVGIARIWNNGKLIWNATEGAPIATVNNSSGTEDWSRMTVYVGSSTQLPDPTYEAAVTTANAIAYRGRSYVFFEAFHLGQQGVLPNLTFEVVADGSRAFSNLAFAAVAGAPAGTFLYSAYGNGAYVIGSYATTNNLAYTHDNGTTWTTIQPFGGHQVNDIFYGDVNGTPTFIAVTNDGFSVGKIWRSITNGETWVNVHTMGTGNSRGCFGNTTSTPKFVFMTTGTSCLTSSDGITWLSKTMPANLTWSKAVFLPTYDKFVAVARTGSGNQIAVSTDAGDTWSSVATPTSPVASYNAWDIAYDGVSTLLTAGSSPNHLVSYDGGVTFVNYVLPNYPTFSLGGTSIIYANRLWVVEKDADEIATTGDLTVNWVLWNCAATGGYLAYGGNKVWVQSGLSPYTLTSNLTKIETVTKSPPVVSTVQSRICLAAGLTAAQYDVTALSSITRDVDSFVWGIASPRTDSEALMAAFFYEAVVSGGKIVFRPLGTASVATIPYLDLGATAGGNDNQEEPFELKQNNDLEIPAQIALTYININNDYQTATEYSDRLISAVSATTAAVTLSVGLTPAEAKGIADTMLLSQVISRFSTQISLLGDYSRLEPTDPVTVTDANGSTFRMRLVRKTDSYPLLKFDAVLDDTSILSSQGITSTDYTSSTTVAGLQDTQMVLMDIPILLDTDDDAGFYVATKGDDSDYPGSAIFRSPSNVTYTQKVTNPSPAVFGFCTSTLGDWTGSRIFDETSTVGVNVDEGTLSSSTKDAVLDDLTINAMLIGSEIIQFVTATLVSAGRYTLSSLLRGCRGTEWAMTGHAANERCVRLSTTGVRRLSLQNNELGQVYYYKGVTLGRAISSANARTFTGTGVGLEPFSPYDMRATRDASNNITFTWQRRSRLSVRMIGTLGISLPLGEEFESYRLDIYGSGSYTTILRTIEAATPTASYTAAQQTTDGLTPGNAVFFRLYQWSATVNRGYKLEASA